MRQSLMAPNGYLHAGTVASFAATSAGYGCIVNLPSGSVGFTTIELKTKYFGVRMSAAAGAGYSGTPLPKKLGFKEASRVLLIGAPAGYKALLQPLPAGVQFNTQPGPGIDIAHVFVTQAGELARILRVLRKKLRSDASVWVSWPKQSAKAATRLGENQIREVALPLGFVDIKVCAVNEVWSGLKLVVRQNLR